VRRVSIYDGLKDSLKSLAKLHGFLRGQFDCLIVEQEEGIVNNDSRTLCPLWHNAHWTDPKVSDERLVPFQQSIGEHHPEPLFDKVEEFFSQEVSIFVRRLVRSPSEGLFTLVFVPRWRGECYTGAALFEVMEEVGGLVQELADVQVEV
jgi:hypothetical protein